MFSRSLADLLSGPLGVGGGFIIVPALKRYTDLPTKSIVTTSLGVLAMVASGGKFFSVLSNFDLQIAAPFAIGALTGLLLGRAIGKKLSGPRLQQLFAITAFAVAVSLLIKGITT